MNLKWFVFLCVIHSITGLEISDAKHPQEQPPKKSEYSCPNHPPPKWVKASNGEVPEGLATGALQGGVDHSDEILYVARAPHNDEIIPGKLNPSHKVAYVGLKGNEYAKSEYEVLTDCTPRWFKAEGNQIPSDAFIAGEANDGPYYVCRVAHNGTITNGKMHLTESMCYIPYGGCEYPYKEYDILTCYICPN